MWLNFMDNYNGKAILSKKVIVNSNELVFYSDSCLNGYGAIFNYTFVIGTFPKSWRKKDIQGLELYPIYLMVKMHEDILANKAVTFFTDNQAIVASINKQSSRNKFVMSILRPMVLTLLQNNISFNAKHIPGVKNNICDSLSRAQVPPELADPAGPWKRLTVPQSLLPLNLLISATI